MVVYDESSNEIVYDNEITSFKLSHTIPADTLLNGNEYNCSITAYDIFGNAAQSAKVSFICLSTPIWRFANVSPGLVINNGSFYVEVQYSQEQGEPLNEHKFSLYTYGHALVWDSGIKYDSNPGITINGFSDGATYYLQASGKTVNGILLDTGLIPVTVEYEKPLLYAVLNLDNKKTEGIVVVGSNIVAINGVSSTEDIDYINDEMVDLRDEKASVLFSEGFSLQDDFQMEISALGLIQNQPLITFEGKTSLYWRFGNFDNVDYAFIELRENGYVPYVIYSNMIPEPKENETIYIYLKRVGGLYKVTIVNKGVE